MLSRLDVAAHLDSPKHPNGGEIHSGKVTFKRDIANKFKHKPMVAESCARSRVKGQNQLRTRWSEIIGPLGYGSNTKNNAQDVRSSTATESLLALSLM